MIIDFINGKAQGGGGVKIVESLPKVAETGELFYLDDRADSGVYEAEETGEDCKITWEQTVKENKLVEDIDRDTTAFLYLGFPYSGDMGTINLEDGQTISFYMENNVVEVSSNSSGVDVYYNIDSQSYDLYGDVEDTGEYDQYHQSMSDISDTIRGGDAVEIEYGDETWSIEYDSNDDAYVVCRDGSPVVNVDNLSDEYTVYVNDPVVAIKLDGDIWFAGDITSIEAGFAQSSDQVELTTYTEDKIATITSYYEEEGDYEGYFTIGIVTESPISEIVDGIDTTGTTYVESEVCEDATHYRLVDTYRIGQPQMSPNGTTYVGYDEKDVEEEFNGGFAQDGHNSAIYRRYALNGLREPDEGQIEFNFYVRNSNGFGNSKDAIVTRFTLLQDDYDDWKLKFSIAKRWNQEEGPELTLAYQDFDWESTGNGGDFLLPPDFLYMGDGYDLMDSLYVYFDVEGDINGEIVIKIGMYYGGNDFENSWLKKISFDNTSDEIKTGVFAGQTINLYGTSLEKVWTEKLMVSSRYDVATYNLHPLAQNAYRILPAADYWGGPEDPYRLEDDEQPFDGAMCFSLDDGCLKIWYNNDWNVIFDSGGAL